MEGINWIDLAEDRDRWWGSCVHRNEPSGSINARNFLSSREPVSFSRRTLLHGVSKCVTND